MQLNNFFSELFFSITPGWEAIRKVGVEDAVVVVVEGYAKSVALASDTVSRVWVDMTSRVVGVNP